MIIEFLSPTDPRFASRTPRRPGLPDADAFIQSMEKMQQAAQGAAPGRGPAGYRMKIVLGKRYRQNPQSGSFTMAARALRAAGLVALTLTLLSCVVVKKAYDPNPAPAPMLPVMAQANPAAPDPRANDGSLWSDEQGRSWFGDDKAVRRGDIILVNVVQKTTGTKKANTDTKRASSISARIKYALGLEKDINDLTDYSNVNADGTKGEWNPNELISADSTSTFTGEGATERADTLQATVSAIVTDVLNNGNLSIYGHQTVTLNNEASVLTVQGIVRPSDIGADNTIDSSRIANAHIEFTGSGILTDKQHPGWANRIFDWVWPF